MRGARTSRYRCSSRWPRASARAPWIWIGGVDRFLGDLGRQQLGHRRRLGDRADAAVVGARRRGGRAGARACTRVATSARRCETAWKSFSGRPNASRSAAWATAASSAACAMPIGEGADAGAEQVERAHRDREAAVDLAEHVLGAARGRPRRRAGRSGAARAARCGSPVEARRCRAGPQKRGQAAGAGALGGAGEDRVDVGVGRVGDPDLLAGQAVAVAVAARPRSASAATSLPASGSVSAKPATASPRREPRDPLVDRVAVPDCSSGNEPRPCTAKAVSASVQPRARPSRIRHSSIADDVRAPAVVVVREEAVEQAVLGERARSAGG